VAGDRHVSQAEVIAGQPLHVVVFDFDFGVFRGRLPDWRTGGGNSVEHARGFSLRDGTRRSDRIALTGSPAGCATHGTATVGWHQDAASSSNGTPRTRKVLTSKHSARTRT